MKKNPTRWLALALAGLTVATQAALIEARQTSFDNTTTVGSGQTSHAGKLTGDSYIDGMWSYAALNYTLGSSPSSFAATTMNYHNNAYGEVFATDGSWLPLATDSVLLHHWGAMGGNNYGVALAFTNVLGHSDTFTLSGSYAVDQNQWNGDGHVINTWIYVVSTGGATTVLFSDTVTTYNPSAVTVSLTSPLTATLQPGDKIYVALGGEQDSGGGDHYHLYDSGLTWSVPEPASLALLGLGGIALLRRRRG